MHLSWLTVNFLYWSTILAPWVTPTPQEIFPKPSESYDLECPQGVSLNLPIDIVNKMVNEWSNDRGLNAADFPNVSSLKNWRINGDNIKYLGENKDSGSCEYGIYIQENQIAIGELLSAGRLKTTVERRVNELELIQAVYGTIKREKVVTDIGYDAKRAYWIIRRPYVSFYETIGYRETIDPIGMPRLYDARRDPNQEKLAFLRSVSERVAQAVKRWCQDDYAKWSSRDSLGLKDILFPATYPYGRGELVIANVNNWADLQNGECSDVLTRVLKAYLDAEIAIQKQLRIHELTDKHQEAEETKRRKLNQMGSFDLPFP